MQKMHRGLLLPERKVLRKLLMMMNATSILLLVFCLQASAAAYAQKVTLAFRNASLKEVFNEVRKQTGYSFIWDEQAIRTARPVTVSFNAEPVEVVVARCMKDQPLTYTIDQQLVVIRARRLPLVADSPEAQRMKISGVVQSAENIPLPGATVGLKSTTIGARTDAGGRFVLDVPGSSGILVVSYIGFTTREVPFTGAEELTIRLVPSERKVDEVVVVGFGTQKKMNLTGAVSTVKMSEVLGDRPVTNVATALQGTVPGLTITGGAAPGASKSINIRGITSITEASPLILVDNVVTTNLDLINPEDIESVSVLKDAASAAIYGARAAFGVVIITTKRGARNQKMQLNYGNNFAFEKTTGIPEKASPLETVQGYKDMGYTAYWSGQNVEKWLDLIRQYNAGPSAFPAAGWVEDGGYRYFLKENDEIRDMTSGQGVKQMHNLAASGGSEHINYRISFGHTRENGVLITGKDGYKRTNASAYINADINKWISSSLDVKYAKGNRTMPKQSGELGMWGTAHPSYYPKDSLPYNGTLYPVNTPANIIRNSSPESWVNKNTRIFSRTEVTPLAGLKGILEYTYETNAQSNQSYNNLYWLQRGVENALDPSDQSTAYYSDVSDQSYQSLNAYLVYEKKFADAHEVKLTGGFSQESSVLQGQWSRNYYMVSNSLPSISGGTGIVESKDRFAEYAIRSGFYRVTYNYKDKYLLEANGRYDGSSKFPRSNRFGFFPSFSAGWNMAREPFMQSTRSWLDALKVRASYGALGNQAINDYEFYAVMNPYQPNWIYNGVRPISLQTPGLIRQDFTWEKVNTVDVGLDVQLLNNRLSAVFDWYQRNTIGMLAPGMDFPAVVGAPAPKQNAADLQTRGWEAGLQWRNRAGAWNYSVGVNVYDSRSFITKFRNENKVLSDYYVGQEIGEIWGYVTDGFYTADDFEPNGALKKGVTSIQGAISREGDIKYKNLRDAANSSNQIDIGEGTLGNPGDRTVIGNNRPRFNFGANAAVGWKNFQLSMMLQGVAKRDAWIGGELMFPHAGKFSTFYKHQLDYWTPDNKDAYYGRLYKDAGESHGVNQRVQTRFLQNAAYLRLKNVTLGYTLPQAWLRRVAVSGAKVFFSGENMLTFTKLIPGVDPELLNWQYPQMAVYSFGLNLNL